jgi:hypothetical protein
MTISRWNRDTCLLALSLSIDGVLRNREGSAGNSDILQTGDPGSNTMSVVGVLPGRPRRRIQKLGRLESISASSGFHTTHAQSGLPAA